MLTATIFLPVIGALVIALLPSGNKTLPRVVALAFTFVAFVMSVALLVGMDRDSSDIQFINRTDWLTATVANLNLQYLVGVDGISAPLIALTTFLTLLAVLISWDIDLRPKEYFVWILVLETGVLGVFSALDLMLFFLFWEVELVPMYMLISVWGTGRKEYSAFKFLIYTIAGSALMLVGLLSLGFSAGSFDWMVLRESPIADGIIPATAMFFLIVAAFAVKLPVVPFHTWLPDAHTDAPTAVSVLLAGVLLKMGGYGIIRFGAGLFPDVIDRYGMLLAVLAAINVLYGALLVLRQTDLKRLVAYSSVSQMGYVLLGIAAMGAIGMTGATVQMVSHGFISGLLFALVGFVYSRTHTREIADMRGLGGRMPLVAIVFTVAAFGTAGLPALSGFVAELLVFLGSFSKFEWVIVVTVFGVVLSAAYMLWTVKRVFHGPPMERWSGLTDATRWWEVVPMGAMVAAMLVVGIYPAVLTDVIEPSVRPIVERLG
ncbi:MAG: NuoM family protein [Dehalococcoidia bacterium]